MKVRCDAPVAFAKAVEADHLFVIGLMRSSSGHSHPVVWDQQKAVVGVFNSQTSDFDIPWKALGMHNRKIQFAACCTAPTAASHVFTVSLRNRGFYAAGIVIASSTATHGICIDLTAGFDAALSMICGTPAVAPGSKEAKNSRDNRKDICRFEAMATTATSVVVSVVPADARHARSLLVSSKHTASWRLISTSLPQLARLLSANVCLRPEGSTKLLATFAVHVDSADEPIDAQVALQKWSSQAEVSAAAPSASNSQKLALCHVVIDPSLENAGFVSGVNFWTSAATTFSNNAKTVDAMCHLPPAFGPATAMITENGSTLVVVSTNASTLNKLPFPAGNASVGCVETAEGAVVCAMDHRTGVVALSSTTNGSLAPFRIDVASKLNSLANESREIFTYRLVSADGEVWASSGCTALRLRVDGAIRTRQTAPRSLVANLPAAAPTVAVPNSVDSLTDVEWFQQWAAAARYHRVSDDAGRAALVAARASSDENNPTLRWIADEACLTLSSEARCLYVPPHLAHRVAEMRTGDMISDLIAVSQQRLKPMRLCSKWMANAVTIKMLPDSRHQITMIPSQTGITRVAALAALSTLLRGGFSFHVTDGALTVSLDGNSGGVVVSDASLTTEEADSLALLLADYFVVANEPALAILCAAGAGRDSLVGEICQREYPALDEASNAVPNWFLPLAKVSQTTLADWTEMGVETRVVLERISVAEQVVVPEHRQGVFDACLLGWIAAESSPALMAHLATKMAWRRSVFLIAAWIWGLRVARCIQTSRGRFDEQHARVIRAAMSWWQAAQRYVNVTTILSTYQSITQAPGQDGSSVALTCSPDDLMAALALRPVAIAAFMLTTIQNWQRLASDESPPDAVTAGLVTLFEGCAGITVSSTAVRQMALSVATTSRHDDDAVVVSIRQMLHRTMGADAEASEKRRYSALPTALVDAQALQSIVNLSTLERFTAPSTIPLDDIATALLPRLDACEALGDWSKRRMQLETLEAFHASTRSWLNSVHEAVPTSTQEILPPAHALLFCADGEHRDHPTPLFAALIAAAPGAVQTVPTAITAPPSPQPTQIVASVTPVVPPPEEAPQRAHVDPNQALSEPTNAQQEEAFFRLRDIAWWEDLPTTTQAPTQRGQPQDDATTVTTATTDDAPQLPRKRAERRRRHMERESESTESSERDAAVRGLHRNVGTHLSRPHLEQRPAAAGTHALSIPLLNIAPAKSSLPIPDATASRFGTALSLPGAPPLHLPVPHAVRLHVPPSLNAPPQPVAAPRTALLASSGNSVPALLRVPAAPVSNVSGLQTAALPQPPPPLVSQPPPAAAPATVATPSPSAASPAVQQPVSRVTHDAATETATTPGGVRPKMQQEDQCRVADALATEHPLPSTVLVVRDDHGVPLMVTPSPTIVNAIPFLDADQELAFKRYVQQLLTTSLLPPDPRRPATDAIAESVQQGHLAAQQSTTAAPTTATQKEAAPPGSSQKVNSIVSVAAVESLFAAYAEDLTNVSMQQRQALFDAAKAALQPQVTSTSAPPPPPSQPPATPAPAPTQPASPSKPTAPPGLGPVEQAQLVSQVLDQKGDIARLTARADELQRAEAELRAQIVRQHVEMRDKAREQPAAPLRPESSSIAVATDPSPTKTAASTWITAPRTEPVTTQTEHRTSAGVATSTTGLPQAITSLPTAAETRAADLLNEMESLGSKMAATLRIADAVDTSLLKSQQLLQRQTSLHHDLPSLDRVTSQQAEQQARAAALSTALADEYQKRSTAALTTHYGPAASDARSFPPQQNYLGHSGVVELVTPLIPAQAYSGNGRSATHADVPASTASAAATLRWSEGDPSLVSDRKWHTAHIVNSGALSSAPVMPTVTATLYDQPSQAVASSPPRIHSQEHSNPPPTTQAATRPISYLNPEDLLMLRSDTEKTFSRPSTAPSAPNPNHAHTRAVAVKASPAPSGAGSKAIPERLAMYGPHRGVSPKPHKVQITAPPLQETTNKNTSRAKRSTSKDAKARMAAMEQKLTAAMARDKPSQ